jgi:hypothetical protein
LLPEFATRENNPDLRQPQLLCGRLTPQTRGKQDGEYVQHEWFPHYNNTDKFRVKKLLGALKLTEMTTGRRFKFTISKGKRTGILPPVMGKAFLLTEK